MAFVYSAAPFFSPVCHQQSVSSPQRQQRYQNHHSLKSRRAFLHIAFAGLCTTTAIPSITMAATDARVEIQDIKEGTGASPRDGQKLYMHYTLTLGGFEDQGGRVVDSSRTRGSYFKYAFNTGAVIKGWDEGVKTMKIGGKRRIIVPPELGYGERGVGPVIPPNSTLYFDIELARIE